MDALFDNWPSSKGQLILKCPFGVFTFFQKRTKTGRQVHSKVEFVRLFFGRNVGLKKSFRICLTFNCIVSRIEVSFEIVLHC